jgi:hypothetical protein
MRAHRIVFRFEGGEADRHRLDASDLVAYETATRQLLATHAHFFTTGRVPSGGALTRGPGYHVYALDHRAGSFEGHWLVEIAEFLAEEALKAGAGHLLKKASRYAYEHLLKDSLAPILGRRPSSMPPEMRIEPVLPGLDKINAPVFDVEPERAHRWGQLRERSTIILPNALRPIGRSAETLVITGENLTIARVDAAAMRRLLEDAHDSRERQLSRERQIAEALSELNLRGPRRSLS